MRNSVWKYIVVIIQSLKILNFKQLISPFLLQISARILLFLLVKIWWIKILANYASFNMLWVAWQFLLEVLWNYLAFVQGKQNSLELMQCQTELQLIFSIPCHTEERKKGNISRKNKQKDKKYIHAVSVYAKSNGCHHCVHRFLIHINETERMQILIKHFGFEVCDILYDSQQFPKDIRSKCLFNLVYF